MRNTKSHERLSGLASVAINKNRIAPKDAEEVLNTFTQKKRRKASAIVNFKTFSTNSIRFFFFI